MVEQGQQRVIEQLEVILAVNAAGKALVVIGWPAHHCQHLARLGIQGNYRARLRDDPAGVAVDDVDPAGERLLGGPLQLQIKRQAHVAARDRILLLHHPQRQAGHVNFPQTAAAPSGQLVLQEELHACVANAVKRRVVALLL